MTSTCVHVQEQKGQSCHDHSEELAFNSVL